MPTLNKAALAQSDGGPALSPRTFERVRKLVYDTAGIDLRQGKETLVSARLNKKLRQLGHTSYEAYLDEVAADHTGDSLTALIDVLTTNFTSFLREPAHFEFLEKTILPAIADRPRVEIWCAAAATGEEPYSLAFSLLEFFGSDAASRCRILATDISTQALAKARAAVYAAERFEGVPKPWLPKYLLRGEGKSKGLYKVKPDVARMVDYRRLNLIEPFTPDGGPFPLISCRNVMIYFDKPTQEKTVNRLSQFLEPGGYLYIGHSESLSGINHSLTFVKPAIYRKAGTMRG
jgi:chemotaxis protein methyltransferase CheR